MKTPAASHWLHRSIRTALSGGFHWRPEFLLTALAVLCVVGVHAPGAWSAFLAQRGPDEELRVQVVVPFAAAWLAWNRRHLLVSLTPRLCWPGLLVLAMAAALWVLADRADLNVLRQLALLGVLPGIVLTLLGADFLRVLAFPLLFLLFAVPGLLLPLAPPLLQMTASLGLSMLRVTGVDAALDGLTIATPFGKWLLTDNCSGVDYVSVYAMAATAFASNAFRFLGRRLAFVGAALLAALLANGLRVWSIVFAAGLNGGVDQGHELLGWLSFTVPLVPLFAVGRRLMQPEPDAPAAVGGPRPREPGELRATVLAAIAVVIVGGIVPAWSFAPAAPGPGGCTVLAQEQIWRAGRSIARTRTLCTGPAGRRQLRELPARMLDAVAPDTIRARDVVELLEPGRDARVRASTLTTLDGPRRYRLTYWYDIGGYPTGSWLQARLRLAFNLLGDRDTPATVVADLQDLPAAR